MNETIAVFDFDGTLTRHDTLLMFLLFQFGFFACVKALWKNRDAMTKYLLRKIPNGEAKEAIFSSFFRGMHITDFDDACRRFSLSRIPAMISPRAMEKAKWHLQKGHTLVILSASIRNWIQPWAEGYGIKHVIATEVEIENGRLTGRFSGENCYGREKLTRFLQHFPQRGDYQLYAYGDSKGDEEMLHFADYAYYKSF